MAQVSSQVMVVLPTEGPGPRQLQGLLRTYSIIEGQWVYNSGMTMQVN